MLFDYHVFFFHIYSKGRRLSEQSRRLSYEKARMDNYSWGNRLSYNCVPSSINYGHEGLWIRIRFI